MSAQNKPYSFRMDSKKWIIELRNITSKSEKIEFVKAKIYSDTAYANPLIMSNNIRDSSRHVCKTIIAVKFRNDLFQIDLLENPNLKSILKFINNENINDITFLDDQMSVAYFGSNGLCGVVILNTRNKKFIRKIRNVL